MSYHYQSVMLFQFLGLAGCVGACAIGAYKFKHKGNMSTSVFLMQLRVAAQGTVVGCLTLGLGYTMAKEYLFNDKPKQNQINEMNRKGLLLFDVFRL